MNSLIYITIYLIKYMWALALDLKDHLAKQLNSRRDRRAGIREPHEVDWDAETQAPWQDPALQSRGDPTPETRRCGEEMRFDPRTGKYHYIKDSPAVAAVAKADEVLDRAYQELQEARDVQNGIANRDSMAGFPVMVSGVCPPYLTTTTGTLQDHIWPRDYDAVPPLQDLESTAPPEPPAPRWNGREWDPPINDSACRYRDADVKIHEYKQEKSQDKPPENTTELVTGYRRKIREMSDEELAEKYQEMWE